MLGKTNLTAIEKGTIVDDVADYRWDGVAISGITSTFIKAIYAGNILVGITADGVIAYTKDGEIWKRKKIELENGDSFEFADIAYGNGKYVIVGYHTDNSTYIHGLIIITEDFIEYEIRTNAEKEAYFNSDTTFAKFVGVSASKSEYFICYIGMKQIKYSASTSAATTTFVYIAATDLEKYTDINIHQNGYVTSSIPVFKDAKSEIESLKVKFASKTDGSFIFYRSYTSGAVKNHAIYSCIDGRTLTLLIAPNGSYDGDLFNLFECKDSLYFIVNTSDLQYQMYKVIGNADIAVKTINIAYGFVDGQYFNKSEVFINNHEMLIINENENIADKKLDDLVEITYDFSLTAIVKAFDRLFVFGTSGNIRVSNDEINNEEALAVKTMSAAKALNDAKVYTDARYAELEARIAALEASTNAQSD